MNILNLDVPLNFKEVIKRKEKEKWLNAINGELKNLYEHNSI